MHPDETMQKLCTHGQPGVCHATVTLPMGGIAQYVLGNTLDAYDCALTAKDKKIIEVSILSEITLLFVEISPHSLGKKLGPAWARIKMTTYLPEERVLYLKADVSARQYLRELTQLNMGPWRLHFQLSKGMLILDSTP